MIFRDQKFFQIKSVVLVQGIQNLQKSFITCSKDFVGRAFVITQLPNTLFVEKPQTAIACPLTKSSPPSIHNSDKIWGRQNLKHKSQRKENTTLLRIIFFFGIFESFMIFLFIFLVTDTSTSSWQSCHLKLGWS